MTAVCGDGVVEGEEACDLGEANRDDGDCTYACEQARCGDGLVWSGAEECDDGNGEDDGNGCSTVCMRNDVCGNGIVERLYERCDDGNGVLTDVCPDGPTGGCQGARCGDGFVWEGLEACDDGNAVETDACLPDCTEASCGDGFVWEGVEQCDAARPPNATCVVCMVACVPGYDDCNADLIDGCETHTAREPKNCGACGYECGAGWECWGGSCQLRLWGVPEGISPEGSWALGLALDQENLYWIDAENDPGDGSVLQMPKDASQGPLWIALFQAAPTHIAVDSTHAYWTNSPGFDGVVKRTPLGAAGCVGCEVLGVGLDKPKLIALDDTHVYWASSSGGLIQRMLKSGGSIETVVDDAGPRVWLRVVGMALDLDLVYWANGADGSIKSAPKDGSSSLVVVVDGQNRPASLAIDAQGLYWSDLGTAPDYRDGSVWRAAKDGSSRQLLASGYWGAWGLLLNDGMLYWAGGWQDKSTLWKVAADGSGQPVMVVGGMMSTVVELAVDDSFIYWTEQSGRVMKAPK